VPAAESPLPATESSPPATESSPPATESSPPATEPPGTPAVSETGDTSTALDATSAFDTPADIDPSTVVEAIPSDLTETLISNVPAALQYGDMAALGLAGWSPAGLVRWSMELINVSTGMPWFWTIIAGSTLWRLACVPWAIRGFQVSARLLPHQPQLLALQKAIAKSRQTQNPLELQKAAQAMSRFYKSHNISPLAGLVSLVQLPFTFGLFFGVQKMCNLPVEQLRDSGFALLPDLTLSDPTMVLPLAMCVLINIQIKVGLPDLKFLVIFTDVLITAFGQGL
jgi:YidC/Oxa1 family membrane protein insertase